MRVNVKKIVPAAVALIIVLLLLSTCWYTVDDKHQAVVTTFGRVTNIADAGVHFKLPFGIQKAQKVEVNVYQSLELGYRTDSYYGGVTTVEDECKMITGDYNIVNVDFFIEYKVSDPVKYLYSAYEPELVLRNLIQSQVRNVVGSTNVDGVLTDGKEGIQRQVKELVSQVLSDYDIGLTVIEVKIQDSEPPTAQVIEAFKSVETAKQQAETVINEATAYQNSEIPAAEAKADSLVKNAEYLRQARINEAVEQVAMFNAMYEQYARDPEITRVRMYYEAIQEALPGVKLYINAGGGAVNTLLPLEKFAEMNVNGGAAHEG